MSATSASRSRGRKPRGMPPKSAQTGTQRKRVATPLMYRYHETKVGLSETARAEPLPESYMTKEELIELSGQIEQKVSDPSIAAVTIAYDKGGPGEATEELTWDQPPKVAPSDNFVVETLTGGGTSSTQLTYTVKGCSDGKSAAKDFFQRLPAISRPKGIYAWRISKTKTETKDDSKDSVGAIVAGNGGKSVLMKKFLQHLEQLRSTVSPQGTHAEQSVVPTQYGRSTLRPRLSKLAEYKCQLFVNQPDSSLNGTFSRPTVWESVFTKVELMENLQLLETVAKTLADGGLPSGSTFAIFPSSLHEEKALPELTCPKMTAKEEDQVLVEHLERRSMFGQNEGRRTWKYCVQGGTGLGTQVKDYVNRAPKLQDSLIKSGTTLRISRNDGQSPLHSVLGRAPEGMVHVELVEALTKRGVGFFLPYEHLEQSGTLEQWNEKRSQARDTEQPITSGMASGTDNRFLTNGMNWAILSGLGDQPTLTDHTLPFLGGGRNYLGSQSMSSAETTPNDHFPQWSLPGDLASTERPLRLSPATPGSLLAPFHPSHSFHGPHPGTSSFAQPQESYSPFLRPGFPFYGTVPQGAWPLSQPLLSAPSHCPSHSGTHTQPPTWGPVYDHQPEDPRATELLDPDNAGHFANRGGVPFQQDLASDTSTFVASHGSSAPYEAGVNGSQTYYSLNQ